MKKRVVFQFTDFDEGIKELAKEIASEFEGVTNVAEVEGREGQLEVTGEFSLSELKKELKKIDESVDTIKIGADEETDPEVKNQQKGKGKKTKVKFQQQGKGKEPKFKIQHQDKGKEPKFKPHQQYIGNPPINIPTPFKRPNFASSSNVRLVPPENENLEQVKVVAKQAINIAAGAAGNLIGLGMEFWKNKNKEKEEDMKKKKIREEEDMKRRKEALAKQEAEMEKEKEKMRKVQKALQEKMRIQQGGTTQASTSGGTTQASTSGGTTQAPTSRGTQGYLNNLSTTTRYSTEQINAWLRPQTGQTSASTQIPGFTTWLSNSKFSGRIEPESKK